MLRGAQKPGHHPRQRDGLHGRPGRGLPRPYHLRGRLRLPTPALDAARGAPAHRPHVADRHLPGGVPAYRRIKAVFFADNLVQVGIYYGPFREEPHLQPSVGLEAYVVCVWLVNLLLINFYMLIAYLWYAARHSGKSSSESPWASRRPATSPSCCSASTSCRCSSWSSNTRCGWLDTPLPHPSSTRALQRRCSAPWPSWCCWS